MRFLGLEIPRYLSTVVMSDLKTALFKDFKRAIQENRVIQRVLVVAFCHNNKIRGFKLISAGYVIPM